MGLRRPSTSTALHSVRVAGRTTHRIIIHHQFADNTQLLVAMNVNDAAPSRGSPTAPRNKLQPNDHKSKAAISLALHLTSVGGNYPSGQGRGQQDAGCIQDEVGRWNNRLVPAVGLPCHGPNGVCIYHTLTLRHVRGLLSVDLAHTILQMHKNSAVAEMGDRLATIDMGRKVGAAVLFPLGELCPYLSHCGRGAAYLNSKFHLDPSNRLATVPQRHRQDRQTGQTTVR